MATSETNLPGWHDHGSISANRYRHRPSGLEVHDARAGARRRHDDRERPPASAGGGDGVFRAFDLKTGKVLWTFQTGHQVAAGRRQIYSVDGKEYIAITSGGTPTSSGGGIASELQVYTLDASQKQSPPPVLPLLRADTAVTPSAAVVSATAPRVIAAATTRRSAAGTGARLETQPAITVRPWDADSSNVQTMSGRLLLKGAPVAHARISVDGYVVRRATTTAGVFHYDADDTIARKPPGAGRGPRCGDRSRPRVDGQRAERAARGVREPQRRLPHRRAACDQPPQRDHGDHRPRPRHRRQRTAAGRTGRPIS